MQRSEIEQHICFLLIAGAILVQVAYSGSAYEAAKGSHALVVLTEWDEFKTLDFEKIYADMVKPAFCFDGRNILPHVSSSSCKSLTDAHVCLFDSIGCLAARMRSWAHSHGFLALLQAKLREIGFITYALGKPLDPFIQVRSSLES